jgi:superfamily II DNA or RNA helicase
MIELKLYRDRCVLDGNLADIKNIIPILDDEFSYTPKSSGQVEHQIRTKLQKKNVPQHVINGIILKIDPVVRLFNKENLEFQPGLARRAMRIVQSKGVDIKFKSYMDNPKSRFKWGIPPDFVPRAHQINAVKSSIDDLKTYHFTVSRMATGGGKTFTACMLLAYFGLSKSMFIVPSQLLLEQAYEDFTYYFGSDVVGRMGAGYHELGAPITIATFQSLTTAFSDFKKKAKKKVKKAEKEFLPSVEALDRIAAVKETDIVIVDEVHHVPADSYYQLLMEFSNAVYIHGYTATDRRIDGGTIQIEAASGMTGHSILAAELINAGYLTPPMIYFRPIPMRDVPAFYHEGDKNKFYREYNNYYRYQVVENDESNELIAKDAMSAANKGKHILVAVNRIEHGEAIRRFIDYKYDAILTTSKIKNSWEMIKRFRNGEFPIMISTLCSEGFNAPNVDSLIIAQDTTDSEQIVGRGLRLCEGKEVCRVDHIYHTIPRDRDYNMARYLTKHAWECRRLYNDLQFPIMVDVDERYVSQSWQD